MYMAKYCPNCGKEVQESFNACPNCGNSLKQKSKEAYNPDNEAKSKIAAGLLGIFFGSLGIHNFYLGYKSKAITQLLLTLCTCGIGAAFTSIWGLIDGIMILSGSIKVDGDGRPLG